MLDGVTLPRGPPFPVSFPAIALPCVCVVVVAVVVVVVVLVPRVPFSPPPDSLLRFLFAKTTGNLALPDATRGGGGDPGAWNLGLSEKERERERRDDEAWTRVRADDDGVRRCSVAG